MTPKTLFSQNITVTGGYVSTAAVTAGKKWVIKSLILCPSGASPTTIYVKDSNGYQYVYACQRSVGETTTLSNIVLEEGEYLQFKAVGAAFNVSAEGYEDEPTASPKVLSRTHVTATGSFISSSVVGEDKSWIVTSIILCPIGVTDNLVSIKDASGIHMEYQSGMSLGESYVVGPKTLIETEYLQFKEEGTEPYDAIMLGYEV